MPQVTTNSYIGFDAGSIFRKRDGIGTYTAEVILAAAKLYPNTTFVGVIFSNINTNDCLINDFPSNVVIKKVHMPWQVYRLFAEFGIWLPVDKLLRINFNQFLNLNFVALPWTSKSVPKKLVIHDASYILYPETMSGPNLSYLKKFILRSVKKTSVIPFTISAHSAELMQQTYGKKFGIAPNSSSLSINTSGDIKDYIFFIGTLEPRKNLSRLVQAYLELPELLRKKYRLVIAGKFGWGPKTILEEINNAEGVTFIESPNDDEREKLYKGAAVLALPSLFEGFGIPALDAAKNSILVVTSKDSPMEEFLTKDGGIFVDPNSVDSISNGLRTALTLSESERQKILSEALQNTARYSWENTAKILCE